MAAARDNAGGLLNVARRVDALTADLRQALVELDMAEAAIWSELRNARETPPDLFVGRRGLSGHALDALAAFAAGRDHLLKKHRTTADMAAIGWAFLLYTADRQEDAA